MEEIKMILIRLFFGIMAIIHGYQYLSSEKYRKEAVEAVIGILWIGLCLLILYTAILGVEVWLP